MKLTNLDACGNPKEVRVFKKGRKWPVWSNIGWMQTNTLPNAYMSFPYGSQAAPNIVSVLRPSLTWSQSDPDPGAVFHYFQIQITNEANNVMILDSGKLWQGTTSPSGSWVVPSDLPAGQKLRVRVMVWDQYGAASNWSPQTWMYINRAPTGNLTFITPIYEHDTPTFTVSQSDPDDDEMGITVESRYEGGDFAVIQQWNNVPSGLGKTFTYGPLPKGNYTLRLTLDDGKGGTFQQTYPFVVLPLSIIGWVNHTPEWETYRLTWNQNYSTLLRASNDFWASEAFVLTSVLTNTGNSSTKALNVTSVLLSSGESVTLNTGDSVNFSGQLLNINHVHTLSQGAQTFRFTVNWSNGLVQTYDVPLNIKGNIYDVLVNQLRH
jgi:hypothetical protein